MYVKFHCYLFESRDIKNCHENSLDPLCVTKAVATTITKSGPFLFNQCLRVISASVTIAFNTNSTCIVKLKN